MKYGIICAMPEEFSMLESIIMDKTVFRVFGREFIEGKIGENDVVAAVSRIGKVAAAVTTSLMIDRFNAGCIVFCGIAGSLDIKARIGDIVIGTYCVQHDFYISDNDRFRIPIINISQIPCDAGLYEKCRLAAEAFLQNADQNADLSEFFRYINIYAPKVLSGVVASGDQFIDDKQKKEEIKKGIPEALCTEMEGAAVAQACFEAGVPCAVIRVISDCADESADVSFEKFVSAASLYSRGIIGELLK